jgi:hypothetical protein
LIHLNSSADQLEKDQAVLGTGWCRCRLRESRRYRTKRLWPPRQKWSSLIVKITGAPMREMIDWIVGTDETVLDAAIDGLIALSGASFLTGVLHVVIEAL